MCKHPTLQSHLAREFRNYEYIECALKGQAQALDGHESWTRGNPHPVDSSMNTDDAEGPLKKVKLMLSSYIQRLKFDKFLVSGRIRFFVQNLW